MSQATIELKDDAYCFVCGKSNVRGLQLHWETEGNQTKSEFYPSKAHQGWRGIVHGGLLATILDEAMTRLAWKIYGSAVTAEINVRYHQIARTGEKLLITGELEESKNRLIPTKAEIRNSEGRLIASATGKAMKVGRPPVPLHVHN